MSKLYTTKLFTVRRGSQGLFSDLESDDFAFGRTDRWRYDWIKRNFGIKLKPGERKQILITIKELVL